MDITERAASTVIVDCIISLKVLRHTRASIHHVDVFSKDKMHD
jgi:hypothetical protein